MKTIRYLAAFLMLATGVMHILPMFKVPADPNALPMLGFAIAYLTTGILLILNKKISSVLGIVFPLIGLLLGFFKIGLKNWDAMLAIMFVIDAVVIVCCIALLMDRNKTKA